MVAYTIIRYVKIGRAMTGKLITLLYTYLFNSTFVKAGHVLQNRRFRSIYYHRKAYALWIKLIQLSPLSDLVPDPNLSYFV